MDRKAFLITVWRKVIKPVLLIGGMALGRIIGMIKDGSPNTIMYAYLLLEIVVVLIGVKLLTKTHTVLKPTSSN